MAPPYVVTAQAVFGLWVNGSLFSRNKLHLLLVIATSEKREPYNLVLWTASEVP